VQQELGGTLAVDSEEGATKAAVRAPRAAARKPNTQPACPVHEQQQDEEEEEEEVRGIASLTLVFEG